MISADELLPQLQRLNKDNRCLVGYSGGLDSTVLLHLLPAFEDPGVGLAAGKLFRFDRNNLDSCGQMLARSRQPLDRG